MIDIEKMKAAALAAANGEWIHQSWGAIGSDVQLKDENTYTTLASNCTEANATFIATANPTAVLELIARLEAAEEENAALLVVIEYIACYLSEREDWHGKNALLQDIALKLASTLAPSTELLDAVQKGLLPNALANTKSTTNSENEIEETPLKATDPCDLERLIMDSNIAKPESAWGAKQEIETLRTQAAELKAENERLKPRHEAYVKMIGELLAVLHADGGHYQYEHGTEKAVEDATTKHYELTRQLAEYKAENERLNTVPMKYRRMAFNAQLQKENEDLQFRNDRLVQDFADVTEENDALRRIRAENIEIFKRQLAEYKADAARLDYLQQGITIELVVRKLLFRVGGLSSTMRTTIREAIDAAMKGEKK